MEICVIFIYIKIIFLSFFFILSFVQVNSDIESEIHALDKFIKETISCRRIPGLSISLVRDGQMIMSRGYGFADIEQGIKASEHTKFCIGSLTKAFTTTLIADILSKQNRITLDTPIKEILGPCFRLSSDLLTDNVNLRDLLAHKVGTPPYFHALVVGFPKETTREELVRRLQYMPATIPFRTKFQYSNYMYALAGHVAEVLSNESWEKMVTDRIFGQLGMRNTGLLHKADSLEGIAKPYTMKNDKIAPIDIDLVLQVSPSDPAGSIYSSATDMSKWMMFHLNNGRNAHGRRLVNDTWLNQTYQSQMTLPASKKDLYKPVYPLEDISKSYNLGWITSSYRGYRKIWHSGGIVTYQSQLWLFPDKNAGVFAVINGPFTSQGSLAIKAVTSRAADFLLQEEPWLNMTTACTLPEPWSKSTKQMQPNPDYIVFKWNISRTPYDYVGLYSHKGFGNITLQVENNSSLFLLFGRFGKMHLQPVTDVHFSGYYMGKLWYFTGSDEHNDPIKMEFVIDKQINKVSGISFPVEFSGPLTLFQRNLKFDWISGRSIKSTSDCSSGINSATRVSVFAVVVKYVLLSVFCSIVR